ncbi:hypothetical protein HMPREF1210_01438 [Paenisporosarcina sp. HGH0030]|uniref:hypothetical protein n=1 Tax=Paenisporosarcina sp. HGH0030 TaxID=1078085 RepID=UPI00034E1628|nr:hypothetical protein HMPREF1210_01438 [Paenisporosarcina sp. HGH0030]
MGKKNLFTVLSISTALLVGTGSAYATQNQKDESVKAVQIVNKESNEITKQEVKVQESKKIPTQYSFTDEAFFTWDGQPDYFANEFLNNQDLFSLLNMNGAELKQELATGKSVDEIASSKNVSTQQVIEVIAKAQTIVQIQGEENGEVPKNSASMEQRLKDIEPKVLQVIEHKSN